MNDYALLIVATVLFAGNCIWLLYKGMIPQAMVLGGWTFANIGVIWGMK